MVRVHWNNDSVYKSQDKVASTVRSVTTQNKTSWHFSRMPTRTVCATSKWNLSALPPCVDMLIFQVGCLLAFLLSNVQVTSQNFISVTLCRFTIWTVTSRFIFWVGGGGAPPTEIQAAAALRRNGRLWRWLRFHGGSVRARIRDRMRGLHLHVHICARVYQFLG